MKNANTNSSRAARFFGRSGDETAHEFRFIVSFLFVMFPNVTLFVIRGGLGSRSASQKKAAKL
jgi:hypothetical protein